MPLLLAAMACLMTFSAAWAIEPAPWRVELASGQAAELVAPPGQLLHLAFRLDRDDAEDNTVWRMAEQLQAPPGWLVIGPGDVVQLGAGQRVLRLWTVRVPEGTAPGHALLHYQAQSDALTPAQSRTLTVTVPAVSVIDADWLPQSTVSVLDASEPQVLHAQLHNRGNTRQALALTLEAPPHHVAELSTQHLELKPGEHAMVWVRIQAPRHRTPQHHVGRLRLIIHRDGPVITLDHALAAALPSASQDLYRRLPFNLVNRFQHQQGQSSWQSQLSGDGALDEAGQHRLNFLIQSKHRQPSNQSRQEMQWLAYGGPQLGLLVGDQLPLGSALLHAGEVRSGWMMRLGPLAQGRAWQLQQLPPSHELAAYRAIAWQHRFTPFLSQQVDAAWQAPQRWLGQQWHGQPSDHQDWQLAWAHSRGAGPEAMPRSGQAWSWQHHVLSRQPHQLRYQLWAWQMSDHYAHPLQGQSQATLALSAQWRPGWRYHGQWQHRHGAEHIWTLGLSAPLAANWRLALQHDHSSSRQRHRLSLARQTPQGSLAVTLVNEDSGQRRLAVVGQHRPSNRLMLAFRYQPQRDPWRGADAPSLNPLGAAADHSLQWFTLQWQVHDSTQLQWHHQPYRRSAEGDRQHSSTLRLHHQNPGGARGWLEWRRQTLSAGRRDHSVHLTWALPFEVPVLKRRDVGRLQGRVHWPHCNDANLNNDPCEATPVSLRIGPHATTTDRQGYFVFRALPSGAHQLHIDRRSLPSHWVPEGDDEPWLSVPAGGLAQADLVLVEAANIEGRIHHQGPAWTADTPLPPLLITLSQGGRMRHTISDARGRFVFHQLPPGSWTLEVPETHWPAQHQVRAAQRQVHLAAGQHKMLHFELWPIERPIHFLDHGTLVGRSDG